MFDYAGEKGMEICKKIGYTVGRMHQADIVHGDLTTSNMLWDEQSKTLTMIDFGLSSITNQLEDKVSEFADICLMFLPISISIYLYIYICMIDFGLSCITNQLEDKVSEFADI